MNHLLHALDSSNEAERIYAIQDIGELDDSTYVIPLINRLKIEESPAVKESIVFCLKKLPCSAIYNDLFDLFRSNDAYLRNTAVMLFGSEKKNAIKFLSSHLDDADKEVRKLILDALYMSKSKEAIPVIQTALNDPSDNVKITAVEYLGFFSDLDSAQNMLNIFEKTTVPMLKTTILEALLSIDDENMISKMLAFLMPDNNLGDVDSLYLPEIIRMIMKVKSQDEICHLIKQVDDIHVYAEDIIKALNSVNQRFESLLKMNTIVEKIVEIIENKNIHADIRANAIELLLDEGVLSSEKIYQLALKLKQEEAMVFNSIQLFEFSGTETAFKEIEKIMNETKDIELRTLCEDIMEGK